MSAAELVAALEAAGFRLVETPNPGSCPQCGAWSRRMWTRPISTARHTVVCCDACADQLAEPRP